MAVPYTFDTVKAQIVANIAASQACDAYYEAVNAIDFLSLIAAGCGYYRWLAAVIMDNDMIDAFPEIDLNQYGVYRLDATLANPSVSQYLGCHGFFVEVEEAPQDFQTLFFVRESNFVINLDGNNSATVYAMGDSVGVINVSGNARINAFVVQNATVTINMTENASACVEQNNDSDVIVFASGNSVYNGWVRGYGILTYSGTENSSGVVKAFGKATVSYTIDTTAAFQLIQMTSKTGYVFMAGAGIPVGGGTTGGGSGSSGGGGSGGGTGGTGGTGGSGGTTTTFKTMTWTSGTLARSAYVWKPAGTNLPIVFAWHGHGGTGTGFSRKHFESFFGQDVIVVYPNGLRTTSPADSTAKNTGWQHSVGEVDLLTGVVDKDLKFYDDMLTTFGPYIDSGLIFNHGWSNGGEFTYDCLWVARSSTLNSICCASAILNTTSGKVALPVMHIAGHSDPVVPFASQQSKFNDIKTLNGCSGSGSTWASGAYGVLATQYSCAHESIFLEYDGQHGYPTNVPPLISQFFLEQIGLP